MAGFMFESWKAKLIYKDLFRCLITIRTFRRLPRYFICLILSHFFNKLTKTFSLIPDFPGMCFASTRCATVEPGNTWDLAPFCGRSTCVVSEDTPPRLLELVEDCGPLPIANPKCKLDTGTSPIYF